MNGPLKIDKFSGEYYFLSNFYPCKFKDKNGYEYKSSEEYYMAHKATNEEDKNKILRSKNAAAAKKIGRQINIKSDWEEIKFKVMYDALKLKFTQNEDLKEKLLNTDNAILIEGNNWGDKIWGQVDGKGENWLGKILMHIRKELQE